MEVMDELCKELDEAKQAMEKLGGDYRVKSEAYDNLRRAHDDHLVKFHAAKTEIEKLALELNLKTEEISVSQQMYEDVKASLHEKDSILKHLTSSNEHLRATHAMELQKLEKENRKFESSLVEANAKVEEQNQMIHRYMEEIKGLKGLVSQKKSMDAEHKAQASKELRVREEMLSKLEQECGKVGEQLKWRNEQFKHLEEAHEKLQNEFVTSRSEWESETFKLLNEIGSLRTDFESKVKVSKDLELQLQRCNQALAYEESRRKLLEIQISESRASYENIAVECQEAKSMIASLTSKRDEEIASLRSSLGMKESHLKEMEFRLSHFELENEELRGSLCEFREAQINEVGAAASLKKLRQKYKSLEKEHGKCISEIQTKKAEWVCQMKNLENDLNKYQSESISRGEKIQELQVELESSYSFMMQLQLQTEELFVELMVLKSKVSEAQESTFTHRQEISARDGSSSDAEQQCYMMQKEIERYEEMLDDSVRCCDLLKEEACQKENTLRNNLKKASNALDEANSSLSQKLLEEKNTKFELDRWTSVAKTLEISKLNAETQLKACFDEIREIRREFEDAVLTKMEIEKAFNQEKQSLTQIAEEKGKKISDLQEQLMQHECARREVEAALLVEMEATEIHEQEKQMFLQVVEKRAKEVEDFEQRIVMLEEKSEFLILSRIETEKKFVQEKVNFLHVLEEKEEKMDCLQQEVDLLEQEITQNEIVAAVVSANITEKTFEQEKEMFCQIAKEKDEKLESLQQHIDMLEKEVFKREILAILSVQLEAENSFEQEKLHYIQIREEKDKEIDDLIQERNRRMEANIFVKSETEKTLEQEKQHFVKIKVEMCEEIDRLREHIILLEDESDRRQKEKEMFCRIAKEKDEKLESLQQHIDMLEKEVFKREILAILSVQSEAENSFEQEKQHYIRIREEKDKEMDDLIQERNRRVEANVFAKSETEKTLEQEKQHFVKIKAEMCEEIDRLREHIILLEEESDRRQKEKEMFCRIAKEKDEKLESLQQHIDMLEKEVFKREILAILSAQSEAENSFEQEKQHYIRITEEKDKEMDDLIQERNRRMEANIFAKSETEKTLEQEKQHLFKIKAEMCEEIDLREHIILLEDESDRRQKEASACTIELENIIQREKTRSLQILEEKDEMIDDLQQQVFALTRSIETAVTLACKEKQKEIDRLREAWEQIRAACILSDVQVHFSYILVAEVEKEIDNLEQKLYMEEKLSTETKQELERLKVKWETDMSEIEGEKDQLEDSRRAAEHLNAELECKLKASHEKNVKLSLEKEELVWQMDEFCNQIGQLTHEDEELMTSLEKVLHRADAKGEDNFGSKKPDELLSSESKVGLHHERRSPLKELNT